MEATTEDLPEGIGRVVRVGVFLERPVLDEISGRFIRPSGISRPAGDPQANRNNEQLFPLHATISLCSCAVSLETPAKGTTPLPTHIMAYQFGKCGFDVEHNNV